MVAGGRQVADGGLWAPGAFKGGSGRRNVGEVLALAQLAQRLPPWTGQLHQGHVLKLKKVPDKVRHLSSLCLKGSGGGMGGLAAFVKVEGTVEPKSCHHKKRKSVTVCTDGC